MPVRPNSIVIDYLYFRDILHDFADLVEDKVFKKMPYNMWRAFSSMQDDVELRWDETKVIIHCDGDVEQHMLCFGDDSFADFLFENYISNIDWIDPYRESDYWEYDGTFIDRPAAQLFKEKVENAASTIANVKNVAVECAPLIKASADSAISSVSFVIDTKVDKSEFDARIQELTEIINKHTDNKENENMKGFNFDFGPMNGNVVRMSMYGLAVKNKTGTYVSYDAKNGEIMDVDIFNFDGAQFIWRMPVAIKDIAVGDVVVHQNVPMFVVSIPEGGKVLVAVDPVAGERKEIMLPRSPFGFNFATKVVNLLGDMFGGAANADNPFGNMWMLMALNGENKMDSNMLVPMMLMGQGNAAMDPTMMMVMMAMTQGNGNMDMNSMLPLMWVMQNMNKSAAPHVCTCGGNCGGHNGQ